jgi:zinc/manganese transport system permease protein
MSEVWFLAPSAALVMGLLALTPLGAQVLRRGVVFIDLAVAQAAAAAALAIAAWVDHPSGWVAQGSSSLGALLAAVVVAWLARRWPAQREALIGLVYVAGACLALLAARVDPHGRERMAELLAADVLWAGWSQVAVLAGCAVGVLSLARWLNNDWVFFPLFALTASVTVPVLGLFLVFAVLIAPALWRRAGVAWGPVLAGGCLALAVGLLLSWIGDAPSGACVALAMACWGGLSTIKSPPSD